MTISIRCENPDCQKPLRVKNEAAGKRLKCPACGHTLLVAVPSATPQPKAQSDAEASPKFEYHANRPAQRQPTNSRRPWLVGAAVGVLVGSLLAGGLVFWWASSSLAKARLEAESAKAELTKAELAKAEAPSHRGNVELQPSELIKSRAETGSAKAEVAALKAELAKMKADALRSKTEAGDSALGKARAELQTAKAGYEANLAKYNRNNIETHGGLAWQKVVDALAAAQKATNEQRFSEAADKYREAQGFLPEAHRTADGPRVKAWAFIAGFHGAALAIGKQGQAPSDKSILDTFENAYNQLGLPTEFLTRWREDTFTSEEVYQRLDKDFVELKSLWGEEVNSSVMAGLCRASLHILLEVHEVKIDTTKKDGVVNIATLAIDFAKKTGLSKEYIEPLETIEDRLKRSFDVSTIRECNKSLRSLKDNITATALEKSLRAKAETASPNVNVDAAQRLAEARKREEEARAFTPKQVAVPKKVEDYIGATAKRIISYTGPPPGTILIGSPTSPKDSDIQLGMPDLSVAANREMVVRKTVAVLGLEDARTRTIEMWDNKGNQYHWPPD